MSAAPGSDEPDEPDAPAPGERVGDTLRTAVERTLAATAGSASETRQRARELLDEVARRGEEAREQLGRRGDAAREEVSERIGLIERRLADLERLLRGERDSKNKSNPPPEDETEPAETEPGTPGAPGG